MTMKNKNETTDLPVPRDLTYPDALNHFIPLCEGLYKLSDSMYGRVVGWHWDKACDLYDRMYSYTESYFERSDFADLKEGYGWFFKTLRGNTEIKTIEWGEMQGEADEYISDLKKRLYVRNKPLIEYNDDFNSLIYLSDATIGALNQKSIDLQKKIIPVEKHGSLLTFKLNGKTVLQVDNKEYTVDKPLKVGSNSYMLLNFLVENPKELHTSKVLVETLKEPKNYKDSFPSSYDRVKDTFYYIQDKLGIDKKDPNNPFKLENKRFGLMCDTSIVK